MEWAGEKAIMFLTGSLLFWFMDLQTVASGLAGGCGVCIAEWANQRKNN